MNVLFLCLILVFNFLLWIFISTSNISPLLCIQASHSTFHVLIVLSSLWFPSALLNSASNSQLVTIKGKVFHTLRYDLTVRAVGPEGARGTTLGCEKVSRYKERPLEKGAVVSSCRHFRGTQGLSLEHAVLHTPKKIIFWVYSIKQTSSRLWRIGCLTQLLQWKHLMHLSVFSWQTTFCEARKPSTNCRFENGHDGPSVIHHTSKQRFILLQQKFNILQQNLLIFRCEDSLAWVTTNQVGPFFVTLMLCLGQIQRSDFLSWNFQFSELKSLHCTAS